MIELITVDELITYLERNETGKLDIYKGFAHAYIDMQDSEAIELIIEAEDDKLSPEICAFTLKVFRELDENVKKALPWLKHFNLKNDRWYPNALDAGFKLSGMYVGNFNYAHYQHFTENGFALSFEAVNGYPCQFTVKYHTNMWPFTVEEWVE